MMSFDGGTAYAESDADDEYERDYDRSLNDHSPIGDDEGSPIDSELSTSAEHTPTTYGHRSSADRLPETIITEWTAEECADFIGTIGLQQYADRFLGASTLELAVDLRFALLYLGLTFVRRQKTRLWERRWWLCCTTISRAWESPVSDIA